MDCWLIGWRFVLGGCDDVALILPRDWRSLLGEVGWLFSYVVVYNCLGIALLLMIDGTWRFATFHAPSKVAIAVSYFDGELESGVSRGAVVSKSTCSDVKFDVGSPLRSTNKHTFPYVCYCQPARSQSNARTDERVSSSSTHSLTQSINHHAIQGNHQAALLAADQGFTLVQELYYGHLSPTDRFVSDTASDRLLDLVRFCFRHAESNTPCLEDRHVLNSELSAGSTVRKSL